MSNESKQASKKSAAQADEKPTPKKIDAPSPKEKATRPFARPARPKRRHFMAVFLLILGVIVPTVASGFYMWSVARDQYVTRIGFSVRSAQTAPALGVLGSGPIKFVAYRSGF